MRVFRLKADLTFEAERIDDALQRLSDHLGAAVRSDEYYEAVAQDPLFQTGYLRLDPVTAE